MTERSVLAVFAKAPVAGHVKTRLAEDIGDDAALRAHITLVEGALQRLARVDKSLAPTWDTCLWLSQTHAQGATWAAAVGGKLAIQQGADLGARMQAAIDAHFGQGYDRVVLVGCDCPDINAAYVRTAVVALGSAPVVFGPAEDGGYGLIAVRSDQQTLLPLLFERMPWGSDAVMTTSRQRLRDNATAWHELKTLWDVDNLADWRRFEASAGE